MASTIHFKKLMQQSNDLFELVLLASKRAKQINALRMAKYPLPTISKRTEEEDYEETPQEYSIDWDGLEKPTTIGLNELLEGKVNFKRGSDEVEGESSAS
ncbi:MAG: DNA-directed RNA polymerase subunit omega [Candidatus Marinimicrobia bacterium]|nr:DNA-directed RNA polymerase subunit omega [Candidatus Neomarinimicrobiota bacterium]